MHANLMSPSSMRNRPNQSEFVVIGRSGFNESSFDMKFSQRRPARGMNSLFQPNGRFPIFTLSIQRSIDNSDLPFWPAPDNRKIFLFYSSLLHTDPEFSRSERCFRNQNKTTRFPIKPVHNRDLPVIGDFKCEELAQFFPKCGRAVRFRRMYQDKRRLIDHD